MNGLGRNQEDRREAVSRPERRARDDGLRGEGVFAGLVASWVKAFSEPRLQTVAESIVPPSAAQKQQVGADPAGHPENMPPAVIVGRVAMALGAGPLTSGQRVRAQYVIHYLTGAGLGVAYSRVAKRWPASTRGAGAFAGLAIYAGTHGSLLPALGIQRPPWRLAPAAVAWETTSHVVFGAALETARRGLGASR
jgi:putative membrane protein